MKELVHRCDVCGTHDTKDNPVSVRVTGVPTGPARDREADAMAGFFVFPIGRAEHTATVDLCRQCAGPLAGMLARRVEHEQAVRAAAVLSHDALLPDELKAEMARLDGELKALRARRDAK